MDPSSLPAEVIDAVCANHGAWLHYLAAALGASVFASICANLRKYIPAPVMAVLDIIAMNFVKQLDATTPPTSEK